MRAYLAIISFVLFICAVSSRSIPSFIDDDDSREVQRKTNRHDLEDALLLARLRNLLDIDDENTGTKRFHVQRDESDDQDDSVGHRVAYDDDNDDSLKTVRKKRQIPIDDDDDDDEVSSNDSEEDDEIPSAFQNKIDDVSSNSDEESTSQSALQTDQTDGDSNEKIDQDWGNNDDNTEAIENID